MDFERAQTLGAALLRRMCPGFDVLEQEGYALSADEDRLLIARLVQRDPERPISITRIVVPCAALESDQKLAEAVRDAVREVVQRARDDAEMLRRFLAAAEGWTL